MRGSYFWQLFVLTGLMVVGQPAGLGYRKPDLPAKSSIGFQLYRDYLIVVQGAVGPIKGLNFLLDTGTTTTVVSPQLARQLHLDATPTDVAVLGGSVKGGIAIAPSLQMGPVRRDNVRVLIEDLSFVQDALPFKIDGIVGLDALRQSSFVIDYSLREIRFGPIPSMPNSIPLQLKDGMAFVDAVVDRVAVRLLVDTAASSLVVFEEMPYPISGLEGGASQLPPSKIGDFDRGRHRQITLKLGDVEFGHESAFVVPNLRDEGHDFDGLMSPVALGFTRVAVDLNQGTLAFLLQK